MKQCKQCNKEYEYIRYHKDGKSISNGTTTNYCNSCMVNRRRFRIRTKIIEYLGGKCSECGYSKCIGALDVHHLDPSKKLFNISGAHARSWSAIEDEIKKCILICSNCHREVHHACDKYSCASSHR